MWRQHLKGFGQALYITVAYFLSAYFAVSALLPNFAIHAASGAAALALLAYLFLVLTRRDEDDILFGICALSPITILVLGTIWWLMRLGGLW